MRTTCMIEVLQYDSLSHWGLSKPLMEQERNEDLNYYALGDLLHRIMEPVVIEDHQIYTRLTIRTDGAGAEVRKKRGIPEKIAGKDIGRKNQFLVHEGQLVVSSIDARNGAVGIVPAEAEGSVVTDNFWVFEVDETLVHPSFLQQILSRPLARQKIVEKSHGTTNRLYITLDNFLKVHVPVPEMAIQHEVLNKLKKLDKRISKLQAEIDAYARKRDEIITKYIGEIPEKTHKGFLCRVDYQDLQKWSFGSNIVMTTEMSTVKIRSCIENFMEQNGESLRMPPMVIQSNTLRYIGMDAVEKETGLLVEDKVKSKGAEIKGASLKVPKGYMIYGRLRPYLNKFWVNMASSMNIVCSSEFLVLRPSNRLNDKYFFAILGSKYIQHQIERKVSGARMPRLSSTDFLNLDVPEPDGTIQKAIGEEVSTLRLETLKKRNTIERVSGQQKEKIFTSYGL